ncbi:zinc-ribbon domain-containing protein [Paenibacillus agricola]|uniref:zinc-ribbon domain-containing protein n=1 Tax=Paenibacillus agricola TaxID=2716264 RepID=UPI001A9FA396|nr:zinc-ribbon domain-containing protein [Paenibacillus agricola]
MEALFCSKCDEKLVDENVPCKYCGTLFRKSDVIPSQTETATTSKSKLWILLVCVIVVVVVVAFIFFS